jgi:uncharacterized protein YxjI
MEDNGLTLFDIQEDPSSLGPLWKRWTKSFHLYVSPEGINAKCITEVLASDIIEKDEEPTRWLSPTYLVPKKNGQWQLVMDMRRANEVVVREHYPIPTIEELYLELNGSQFYSKLNMKWELSDRATMNTEGNFGTHRGL